jgi:hypothetical protein
VDGAPRLPTNGRRCRLARPINDRCGPPPPLLHTPPQGNITGSTFSCPGSVVLWGPTINLNRDPRWGRNGETSSEDPLFNSLYGAAYAEGAQVSVVYGAAYAEGAQASMRFVRLYTAVMVLRIGGRC